MSVTSLGVHGLLEESLISIVSVNISILFTSLSRFTYYCESFQVFLLFFFSLTILTVFLCVSVKVERGVTHCSELARDLIDPSRGVPNGLACRHDPETRLRDFLILLGVHKFPRDPCHDDKAAYTTR